MILQLASATARLTASLELSTGSAPSPGYAPSPGVDLGRLAREAGALVRRCRATLEDALYDAAAAGTLGWLFGGEDVGRLAAVLAALRRIVQRLVR